MRKTMMMMVAGAMLLGACNTKQHEGEQNQSTTETAAENTPATEAATIPLASLADTKDHVCGMDLSPEGVTDTLHHDGKVYGFCAPECKAEFAKNPSQYLAN